MKTIKDPHFKKLHETSEFVVGNVFEYAYLINKKNHKEIYMGGFCAGDPSCGLIEENNNWCVVGGEILNVWSSDNGLLSIEDEDLNWVVDIRQKSSNEVELLIDPWSDKGSVWELNIKTLERHKIRDYLMANEEYTDEFDW
ncbi:MAG: hypothetical protein JO080_14520 [Mucilaginibacter sp.]|nr:hypothetical protein [Mucilaginibacter sp.]